MAGVSVRNTKKAIPGELFCILPDAFPGFTATGVPGNHQFPPGTGQERGDSRFLSGRQSSRRIISGLYYQMDTSVRNRAFALSLIHRLDPSYRQRWEIYDDIVRRLTGPDARWLDGGCGINLAVAEFPCALNVGMDAWRHPRIHRSPDTRFVLGDLEHIPFRDGAFSLVTLNTVAEHFQNPEAALREIHRVLEPGGHLLVHTTNIHSPLILLGKLLPQSLRRRLFTRSLGAQEDDIFPAFHRLNTAGAFRAIPGFKVVELHRVQDLNWTRRPVFLALLGYHLMTRLPGLRWMRTNLVVLLRKDGGVGKD